jgi:hypothetical protein
MAKGNTGKEGVYACKCGFKTADYKDFRRHCFIESSKEGKGTHISMGVVDADTGKMILPPWKDRTEEQKARGRAESRDRSKAKQKQIASASKTSMRGNGQTAATVSLAEAHQVKFVPRVFTCDYTPIMRAAREVAVREWGWSEEMDFSNFLDTILWTFFRDREIVLAGYVKLSEAAASQSS